MTERSLLPPVRPVRFPKPGPFHLPFIQGAIHHPGALRAYVHKTQGPGAFTERGTIKVEVLRDLAKHHGVVGRRARFALELRRFRHG